MSSRQPPSNNSNNNNNRNRSYNSQQRQISGQLNENDLFQQMYSYPQDADEDFQNEIVAQLDARNRMRSNIHDEDEAVFSDVVQDAFKKYQNEQEELYAQMEECWNYMAEESGPPAQAKPSTDQSQSSFLNPDANEFKPSWLSSSTTESLPTTSTSNQSKEEQKKF